MQEEFGECVFVIFLNLIFLGNRETAEEFGSQLSVIHGKQNYFF